MRPIGIFNAAVGRSLLTKVQSDLRMNLTAFHLDYSEVTSIDEQGFDFLMQALNSIINTRSRLLIFSTNEVVRSFFTSRGINLSGELPD